MHLTPEQLIDIAEGTTPSSAAPHLASCGTCRQQLADLRAMMTAAADADAPEPSPLFWDHLSSRVHEAVDAEPAAPAWNWWLRAGMPFALATGAAILIAFIATTRLIAPHAMPDPPAMVFVASPPPDTLSADVTDPSLALVADLTQDLGFDEAREAGLAPRGSAEHAVTHLSEDELRQLKDLLQEEMGKSSD